MAYSKKISIVLSLICICVGTSCTMQSMQQQFTSYKQNCKKKEQEDARDLAALRCKNKRNIGYITSFAGIVLGSIFLSTTTHDENTKKIIALTAYKALGVSLSLYCILSGANSIFSKVQQTDKGQCQ